MTPAEVKRKVPSRTTRLFLTLVSVSVGLLLPLQMAFADCTGLRRLSAAWWQWALSIPASHNPMTDPTGEQCMIGQRGPVWFLAGVFGDGTATRTCTVPEGVDLFFPIFNQSFFDSPNACGQGAESLPIPAMRALIAEIVDGITNVVARVDGEPVAEICRMQSKVFAVALPAANVFETPTAPCPAGIYAPTVDDGYYVRLGPLPVGKHRLRFRAKNPDGSLAQDVRYHLTVAPVVNGGGDDTIELASIPEEIDVRVGDVVTVVVRVVTPVAGRTYSFSISEQPTSGQIDAASIEIDPDEGILSFRFEAITPTDIAADNIEISVIDSASEEGSLNIPVRVGNVRDRGTFVSQ